MEIRINFPPSNDKIWKKNDEELEIIIPKVFNQRLMNKLTTSELSQKFDFWLHQFFIDKFGEKKDSSAIKAKGFSRQKRPNKALEHLRKRKKTVQGSLKSTSKSRPKRFSRRT